MTLTHRKYLIAGNWKMNLLRNSALQLTQQLMEQVVQHEGVEVALCPPSVYLAEIGNALRASPMKLGGQNMHAAEEGAFTGELSGRMLRDVGCHYVILGHSERRQYFGETDASVNQKIVSALVSGLAPIVCLGETLEQREGGQTERVIETQFQGAFANLTSDQVGSCAIAYEPVWAIGTGRTASPEQAEAVHRQIRDLLTSAFGALTASRIKIQYGGSVKADNAMELLSKPNIDGALVGGASLKADSFVAIVQAAAKLASV